MHCPVASLPPPDGKYLVFRVSLAATEAAVVHVIDVATAKRRSERLEQVTCAAPWWLLDSRVCYNRFAGCPADSPDYYNDRSVRFGIELWRFYIDVSEISNRSRTPVISITSPAARS